VKRLLPKLEPIHVTGLKLAFTLLLLGLLIRIVGWRSLIEALRVTRGSWLAANYAFSLMTFSLIALTLHWTLVKLGVRIRLRGVLFANAMANFYSLVLPGDLLAGVSKWALLSTVTGDKLRAASAMILNKVSHAVPPVIFGILALAWQDPVPGLPVGEVAGVLALLGVVGAFVVWHPKVGVAVAARLGTLLQPVPAAGKAAATVLDALHQLRALGRRDLLKLLSLSLLVFTSGLLGFFCATRALGLRVSILTLIWVSLAMFVARLLPLTFNNLGVREGLLMLALGTQNVQPAQAFGLGLVMFSNAIVSGLIGAGCQVAVALGWVRLSESATLTESSSQA
jgi:uncharacterized membrane protein YbhN (UPF0104 family)